MPSHLLPNQDRLDLMEKGVEQLHTWLNDVLRTGILEQDFSDDSLSEVAARMVDAKMGSIGRRIRQFSQLDRTDLEWSDRLRHDLALLYLFVINFKKLSSLTLPMQMTVLNWAGFNIKKKDLNPAKGIHDTWYVLGVTKRREEQLQVRKCWMVGAQSHRFGVIIDFAFGRTRFELEYSFQHAYRGRLNYYPSSFPVRAALFSVEETKRRPITLPAFDRIEKFLDQFARALAKNPWITSFPCSLKDVILVVTQQKFSIVDQDNLQLAVVEDQASLWSLLAVSGGHPITVFGEWNGYHLKLMSYWQQGKIISLDLD